jgi:hypothetical protein
MESPARRGTHKPLQLCYDIFGQPSPLRFAPNGRIRHTGSLSSALELVLQGRLAPHKCPPQQTVVTVAVLPVVTAIVLLPVADESTAAYAPDRVV